MSKVILNEKETDIETFDYISFAELFDTIIKSPDFNNMSISKVELNGELLTEDRGNELSNLPGKEIQSLKIQGVLPKDIAYKIVNDLLVFTSKLSADSETISGLLRSGQEEKANKTYEKHLQDIQLFLTAVDDVLVVLKVDKETIINEKSLKSTQENLLELTRQMLDSQNNKDWIMLADLLEYELTANLEQWKGVLEFLDKNKK